jgi:methyl-accepting chemotaxis protein
MQTATPPRSFSLLRPGVRLMGRLHMPAKIALLGLVLAIPLLIVTALGVRQGLDDIGLVRSERAGLEVVRQATALVDLVQVHRGLTRRLQTGDSSAQAPRARQREALRVALTRFDAVLAAHPGLALETPWTPLRASLAGLLDDRFPSDPAAAFAWHSRQVDSLGNLMQLAGERSRLLVDPDPSARFLVTLAVERSVPWLEAHGQARGLGSGWLAQGGASLREQAQMLALAEQIERQSEAQRKTLEALLRSGMETPASWGFAMSATAEFVGHIRKSFGPDASTQDARTYFDAGSAAIQAALRFNADVVDLLDQRLAERHAASRAALIASMVLALAGIVTLAYLATCLYITFTRSLREVQRAVGSVARGDLAYDDRIRGHDELTEVGHEVDRMAQRLSVLVGEIRTAAVLVDEAGDQVAANGQSLADRTSAQAVRLRHSLAQVKELSQGVARSAEAAANLETLLGGLEQEVGTGGLAMQRTCDSMDQLEASHRRVAEINSVIDDLAFQTNLLALNAAVEASKAGESGRGFAVVAAEVRQLAGRCSQAAAEIGTVIEQTARQSEATRVALGEAKSTLDGITDRVSGASGRLRDLAAEGTQHSQTLDTVGDAVHQLDQLTIENAGLVEAARQAARSLADQSAVLSQSVASIRLRHGSVDEARALAEAAAARVMELGEDAACAEFADRGSRWFDRDMYVWVLDGEGRYRFHAARPDYPGKTVFEVIGPAAEDFMDQVRTALDNGGGYADHPFPDLHTRALHDKTAYVLPIGDGAFLGVGVYRRAHELGVDADRFGTPAEADPVAGRARGLAPA